MLLCAAIVGLSACATIPSGHLGVLVEPTGLAARPVEEGVRFIGPFARVEIYDLRAKQEREDFFALSAEGEVLEARASVVAFHPIPTEVVSLAREVGPDYYQVLVRPILRSTARRVLAKVSAAHLDTPSILGAQAEIARLAVQELRAHHVELDGVDIRTLNVPTSSAAYQSVISTGVAQQRALAAPSFLALARQRAEAARVAARGVAGAHGAIANTLTPSVLADLANKAWNKLLAAPSTTIDVVPAERPHITEVSP